MKTEPPSEDAFRAFLAWLSPDREEAEVKYEQLRRMLIRFFTWGGCHVPDELFDETINRASKKIASGAVERSVKPYAYCRGVARNVLHEYWDEYKPGPLPDDVPWVDHEPDWSEEELACLDQCLLQLSEHNRFLVTRYTEVQGAEKIKVHRQMAAEEGGPNALRIRIYRIKNVLRDCVIDCLSQANGALTQ